jgi:hypothetical protein
LQYTELSTLTSAAIRLPRQLHSRHVVANVRQIAKRHLPIIVTSAAAAVKAIVVEKNVFGIRRHGACTQA